MALRRRTERLNSLLKEVISDVVRNKVKNPELKKEFLSITKVEITKDLRQAKVYFSIIGDEEEKNKSLSILQSAAGFISLTASKMVVMHHFPTLAFKIDDTVEKHMRVNEALKKIQEERQSRKL